MAKTFFGGSGARMGIRLRVTGIKGTTKRLAKAMNNVQGATCKGFYQAGLYLLRKSKQQVPVDSGNLRASGFLVFKGKKGGYRTVVGESKIDRTRITADKVARTKSRTATMKQDAHADLSSHMCGFVIGYAAEYAMIQHEVPYIHKVGNWKYLQKPMMEYKREILEIVANSARKGFKK